jgi:carbonic anhydrase
MTKIIFLVFLTSLITNCLSETTTTGEGLLDYTEANWPDTCKGKRQSPIDFPPPDASSGIYQPLSKTGILFNTYKQVTNITMFQIVPDAKFAFKQADMGELYFQKNGLIYRYILNEIHFHTVSEHTFNGSHYDLEMHMVHSKDNAFFYTVNSNVSSDPDTQQQKLVVGILFTKNDNKTNLNSNTNNTFIQGLKLWNTSATVDNFTLNDFVRTDKFFLHYEGGLTTPTCNEFVNWVVMTQLEKITSSQLNEFLGYLKAKGYPNGNYRKAQALNGRKIYYNDMTTFSPLVLSANSFNIFPSILLLVFFLFLMN